MSSLPIEGTITARPFDHDRHHGTITGTRPARTGSISGDVAGASQSAAVAELGNLITSLGSLAAQAQGLPLSPPSLPSLPQGGYQPRATDYTQFVDEPN